VRTVAQEPRARYLGNSTEQLCGPFDLFFTDNQIAFLWDLDLLLI
jgi:hypothetical protein